MKVYFMGSYVNGAVNTPKNDILFEELASSLHPGIEYQGAKIDKESRVFNLLPKLRKELREADVLFLHPSRMDTSYFEIREALNLGREIWFLTEPRQFEARKNYPYSLPNFKFIGMDTLKPLLASQTLEGFLEGLTKGEVKE